MIEIITFHKSVNYGALLQSLSLKEFIENQFKTKVYMCEYHPKKLLFAEYYRPMLTKKIDKLYKMYSNNIIPQLGEVIVGDREPYEYLVKSIKNFSSQDEVLNIMEKIGFKFSKFRSLFMGVVSIHTGWKI